MQLAFIDSFIHFTRQARHFFFPNLNNNIYDYFLNKT